MRDRIFTIAGVSLIVVGVVIAYALFIGATIVGTRTLATAWYLPLLPVIAGLVVLFVQARRRR